MVSRNGFEWHKPNLGLVDFQGSRDNKIVVEDIVNSSVFIDPRGKPEERYKLLYTAHRTSDWDEVRVAGIMADTQHVLFWDPRINMLRISA